MPNLSRRLDRVFHTLGDPTRLAVVERLGRGPAPVTELARGFDMALPSFLQHLRVLEVSGLVRSRKSGRVRTVTLSTRPLRSAESWLARRRTLWDSRLDRLDSFLLKLKSQTAPRK